MHRADVLSTLARTLPEERVHLGQRLTVFVENGHRVEARFAGGASVETDVLVGADGIHSTVRGALFDRPPLECWSSAG
jgi:2-polyprenyl-6-methoxyphenol hydroxylase-like FAD-dependent oxidoreductase